MRGYPAANRPAFKVARETLQDMGHNVFCPSQLTESMREAGLSTDLREMLRIDLTWICNYAEGLVGLPGWGSSKGSLAEVHLAWAINIPVYEYEQFSRRILKEIKSVQYLNT
jgi:hypothetical protein